MDLFYAFDENNICVGLIWAINDSNKPQGQTYVKLDKNENYDVYAVNVGKRYNNGVWEEVPQPSIEQIALTEEQEAIFQTQANTEYANCLLEMMFI